MDKGIVLYEIELNGCLNGVYTNDGCDGLIYNEIATKHSPFENDDIAGTYDCSYFEDNNMRKDVELSITRKKKKARIFDFKWSMKGRVLFEGIGFKMNNRQVAVTYWEI